MAIFLALLILAIGAYWFYHFLNKPTPTYEQTQHEAAGLTADDIIENLNRETARIEAFIQAGIVGDQKTVDDFNNGNYHGPLPEKRGDGGWLSIYDNLRILKIAGINHRQGINSYIGRVECALVPEPTNKYDPEAIKIVAEDNHHLGYIPSDQTDFVRSLAANEFPYLCTAFISQEEDEDDGHKFFVGFVYIKRLD